MIFRPFSFYFHELSPKTRLELGRRPDCSVPNFVKLRRNPSKTKYLPSRLCVASTANGGGFRNPVVEGDGIIIVDHGSRRKESNLMLSKKFFCSILWCWFSVFSEFWTVCLFRILMNHWKIIFVEIVHICESVKFTSASAIYIILQINKFYPNLLLDISVD